MHGEYTLQSQAFLMHHEVQPSRWRGSWAIVLGKEEFTSCLGLFLLLSFLSPGFVLTAHCLRLFLTPLRGLSVHRTTPTLPRGTAAPTTKSYPHDVPGALSGQRSPELSVQQAATRVPRAENVFLQAQWFYPGGDFCLPQDTWQSLETTGVMTGGMY